MPNHVSSMILIGASLMAALGAMSLGELSERIGRKKVFLGMGVIRLVALPLLFLAMAKTDSIVMLVIYVLVLSFIANGSYGPLLIFLNERFPTALRSTGTGLSWNVGFALGGMMPTFVSLAASGGSQHLPMVLAVFTTAVSVVYMIGAVVIPETRGNLRLG